MNQPTPTPAANPEQPVPIYRDLPYAWCCNGDPEKCDCVRPDHGTAKFQVNVIKRVGPSRAEIDAVIEGLKDTPPTPAVIAPSAETASETPTPRTDALFDAWENFDRACELDAGPITPKRWPDLARQLERELTQAQADLRAAQQERDEAKSELQRLAVGCCRELSSVESDLLEQVAKDQEQLAAAQQERDEAREDTRLLDWLSKEMPIIIEQGGRWCVDVIDSDGDLLSYWADTPRAAISAAIAGEKS